MKYLNKTPLEVLKEIWGYDSFRPNQLEAIEAYLRNEDVLYLDKTSGGKSLVFQLPALIRPGTTLIISPLLSLMTDQIEALKEKGVRAETINSTLGVRTKRSILKKVEDGEVDLLYMAPESILNADMIDILEKSNINGIVADEAHCLIGKSQVKCESSNYTLEDLYKLTLENKPLPKVRSYNTETGELSYKQILNVFKNPKNKFKKVKYIGRDVYSFTTEEHVYIAYDGDKPTNELIRGDNIISTRSYNNNMYVELIESVEDTDLYEDCYDIEVEDNHNYFTYLMDDDYNISTQLILVHNCFSPRTKVYTDKGDFTFQRLYKLYQEGAELPLALSKDIDSGKITYNKITKVFQNPSAEMLEIKLSNNNSFTCTKNHEIFVLGKGFVSAEDIQLNDRLDYEYEEDVLDYNKSDATVSSIKSISHNYENLYDIEVENNHNYYINAKGLYILVHNCISSYGHDFRPKYKQVGALRHIFDVPVMALTATADKRTVEDIKKVLQFEDPKNKYKFNEFKVNLDRPNIEYNIYNKLGNGYKQTLNFIQSHPEGTSGIVYCMTKKETENISRFLYTQGIKTLPYHAGLKTKLKDDTLSKWSNNEIQVVAATIAFGMGIDKPDCRFVIHLSTPTTLEGYCQEAGRAGRDGLPSKAYLLYSKKDIDLAKWIFKKSTTNPASLSMKYEKLNDMVNFINSKNCYRKQILEYFNQDYKLSNCNSCSYCLKNLSN